MCGTGIACGIGSGVCKGMIRDVGGEVRYWDSVWEGRCDFEIGVWEMCGTGTPLWMGCVVLVSGMGWGVRHWDSTHGMGMC
eukprot:741877-Rhodomonas_salina.1